MGENFGVEKRWKKKIIIGQGGWDFRPSRKWPQWAHPQLVHWWVLIHSSLIFVIYNLYKEAKKTLEFLSMLGEYQVWQVSSISSG